MPPQYRGRGRAAGNRHGGSSEGNSFGRGRDVGGSEGGQRGRGGGFSGSVGRGGYRGRGGDYSRGGGFVYLPAPSMLVPRYVPNPAPAIRGPGPRIAPGVVTVGVRRPIAPGTLGRPLTVTTNSFAVTIPEVTIYRYDDIRSAEGDEVEMPFRFKLDLIGILQTRVAPNTFTPRAVYDGGSNIYASRRLNITGEDWQMFNVPMPPSLEGGQTKVYSVIILNPPQTIDTSLLNRYQKGQQSYDNMVPITLAAVNVIIRMDPLTKRYPYSSRSFFADKETWSIGRGIDLWRGYFQSVRPGLHSMLLNVDISTGTMYTPGPMIPICQAILANSSANALVPGQGLNGELIESADVAQGFLRDVKFTVSVKDKHGRVAGKPKVLKRITSLSAANHKITLPDESETTVAQYFRTLGARMLYPNYVSIESATGVVFPIEFCSIIPGQMIQKQLPSRLTKDMVMFSTKRPNQRLDSIVAAHWVLKYGQSEYMRQFGMTVSQTPESCLARVLPTPALNYGPGSMLKQLTASNGTWNMQHQKLFKPAIVTGWALVVYDNRNIRQPEVDAIIHGLKSQADRLGIRGFSTNPSVSFPKAQYLEVHNHLQAAGVQVFQETKAIPSLIVVVMPCNSAELYQAVKHFGDVTQGVPTQCLMGSKASKGGAQYFANVWLKINAKLGGINAILDPNAQKFISDAANPVMIIGADVMHPAPGTHGCPSFPAVVGSVDSHAIHYVAVSGPQESRVEMILDLENMVYELIGRHTWWKKQHEKEKKAYPKRIVFYRNGVSEGRFVHVLEFELKAIKDACKRHNIDPAITVVVVNKRHHVRFFPTHGMEDKSGNCPAGTVVDTVVGYPTRFDFYLQSHGGLMGTSRSTHYSVLHDENNFTPDSLQALSFALCHVYTRATRSVSIPAPVYYADIVTGRAKNHFDPSVDYSSIDDAASTTSLDGSSAIMKLKDLYKPAHVTMRYKMFFL